MAGVLEELAQAELAGDAAQQLAGEKSIASGVGVVWPSGYRAILGMSSRA